MICKFVVDVPENLPTLEALPVYFDNRLVGSIVRTSDDSAAGFIAVGETPLALKVDINEAFFLTPKVDNRGIVQSCEISEYPASALSRAIKYAMPYQSSEDLSL